MSSIFFLKKKNIYLNKLFPNNKISNNFIINGIKSLDKAKKNDLTFFDKKKYEINAKITKAGACITTKSLSHYLSKDTQKIIVKNVLYELAHVLKKIYPLADVDYPDLTLKNISKNKYKLVKFGNNVLVGKNVILGKNTIIGSNTIIEHDVQIGDNCIIGSNVIIKNSIIGKRVVLQDNCKIGQKGFGFIPSDKKNIKFPHIGRVLISDDVEIGSGCTIDRGSIEDTSIGSNTYLDNQVHMAHNVKIGSNCMIAGQVGFAGSSTIGNNVSIGGQAGISGHLMIGDNVKIAGGSGVIKDIKDNQIVMGYPAIPFKDFIKNWKK
jgi:UDP-3-O-[3-hydroxymyristoyl] glucosamine N-acyltransferase